MHKAKRTKPQPNKIIGGNIAHYRKKLGLSQGKLAAIVSIEIEHLSRIETGLHYPRMNLIARLAVALGVSIDELITSK